MNLGRYVNHDPRSKHPTFHAARHPIKSVQHATYGLPLDQGQIGSCTANALVGALMCAPNYVAGTSKVLTEHDAQALYHAETVLEGQPWPPNDPGGSGLEVCKAAKNAGLITAYHHAFGLTHALQALAARPVITGINWYDSFDHPDANGVVRIAPGAQIRGGHEIVAVGIDTTLELVWFVNSWGPSWGKGGSFAMKFDTWDQLLHEQGDVTVPIV